jgi:hypothetical protein
MIEIKLDAYFVDGKIEIPEGQRKELSVIKDGSPIELILRANDLDSPQEKSKPRDILQEMEDRGYDSIINYLMDYPLQIEGVEYLTREEIYSGKRFQ